MRSQHASATALLVALSVLRLGAAHGLPVLSMQLAKQALIAAGGGWRWLGWLAISRAGLALLSGIEALSCKGLARHHRQRKAWLQERLLAQPVPTRLLWLGCGFDGAGLSVAANAAEVALIELDHPASLCLRQQLPVWRTHSTWVQSQPMCLPQQSDELLALCAQAPSVLVAEGVLMYLPARSLIRLLAALSRLPAPPRLLFSSLDVLGPEAQGFRRSSRLRDRWLVRRQESFRWRATESAVIGLLARCGYRVTARWAGSGFGEFVIDAVHERTHVCD